jgi:hypothetical protein
VTRASLFGAEGSTVAELLNQHGQGFYVPIYQRGFTWSKDDVDQLLEDLLLGTSAAAAASAAASVSMFIGSVIVLSDKKGVDPACEATPAEVLHVIDGQQRLTTLVLICAELYVRTWQMDQAVSARSDVTTNPQAAWISKRLKHCVKSLLTSISFETNTGSGLYERAPRLIRQGADLWGDSEDTIAYESDAAWYVWEILQQHHGGMLSGVAVPPSRTALSEVLSPIAARLDQVQNAQTELPALDGLATPVASWAADLAGEQQPLLGTPDADLDAALRLVTFIAYVQTGLMFIDVRAPSAENAFALFEPLNTSGQMLTPLETLKPTVISVEGGVTKYLKSASKKHMDRLDELFPPTDEKARRAVADFIGTTALADKGEARIGKSLQPQRRYLRQRLQIDLANKRTEQRAFIKAMKEDAEFFAEAAKVKVTPAHLANASEADRLYFRVLQESKHTIAFPMLARYQAVQTKAGKTEYLEVMRAVVAFYALWRTSRSSTSGIDDIHRDLMSIGYAPTSLAPLARWNAKTGAASAALPAASDVKQALVAILHARGKITSKQAWAARMTAQNLYDNHKVLSRLLLLAAHDDAIAGSPTGHVKRGATGCNPTLTVTAWEQAPTVEHIAPQNPGSADVSYETAIYDDDLVGHIGNLTLLPADVNNLVADHPWPIKRQFFEILGEPDPQQRLTKTSNLVLPLGQTLGKKARASLLEADFMSLTPFVARRKSAHFSRDFVDKRGKVLAGLAWDRLYALLV